MRRSWRTQYIDMRRGLNSARAQYHRGKDDENSGTSTSRRRTASRLRRPDAVVAFAPSWEDASASVFRLVEPSNRRSREVMTAWSLELGRDEGKTYHYPSHPGRLPFS